MNIIELFRSFTTQEQAVEHLEKVRWAGEPNCPYCGSLKVGRHASGDRSMARWQCRECSRAFAVTVGTLFHGTHVPLRSWFLVLALMLNAKKSVSAYQVARDLGMRRPTVWSMMRRIRTAIAADPVQERLLHGIVNADVMHIGSNPDKRNKESEDALIRDGQGNAKMIALELVERDGRSVAQLADLRGRSAECIKRILASFVETAGTVLITDDDKVRSRVNAERQYAVICRDAKYAYGPISTKIIGSFWAMVRRTSHYLYLCYSPGNAPLRVAEVCYKYNYFAANNVFDESLRMSVGATA